MDDFSLQVQSVSPAPGGATQTAITDYSSAETKAELTTNRFDSPAKLTFTVLEQGGISIPEGSSVELAVDGVHMFKGYVFTAEQNQDGEVQYTAYDQLRYLKANASYTFENMTLGQIIQQIAADFGLQCGALEDTGYIFPCLIKENESCLDIIFDALAETIYMTGKIFVFYDDVGALTLRETRNMYTNILIGDKSLATDFTYRRDIDSDTYNRVKLVRPNSETGMADTYIVEDTATQAQWGLLQYYDQVDENLNAAQIEMMCEMYLKYYNRVVQELSISALGVPGFRAGMIVPVKLSAVDSLSVSRLLLAEKVTHSFDGDDHTMTVEVKNFDNLGGDIQIV
ncbi:hypothetical protein B5E84_18075 [Lachnoclostridium sp. An14]|uniref:XkdQ/YqbQ family protein n=1 Tax=Lachnoclostridium sp. An14 TaxID=1965562 RepID=UPI000B37E98D|nr:hypothetical protein [Lachnoclostridium sp. An14]OUQ13032.1 hypothetical protein B5E84_18075 [Lachnoclostridium sp. An14]